MSNTIKHKRATGVSWASTNPVLAEGEIGLELDLSGTPVGMKVGNGSDRWNSLLYMIKPPSSIPPTSTYNVKLIDNNDSDYLVDTEEDRFILVDSRNGDVNIILPSAQKSEGKLITIKPDRYGSEIYIEPESGEMIDDGYAIIISQVTEFVTLLSGGIDKWHVVCGNVQAR